LEKRKTTLARTFNEEVDPDIVRQLMESGLLTDEMGHHEIGVEADTKTVCDKPQCTVDLTYGDLKICNDCKDVLDDLHAFANEAFGALTPVPGKVNEEASFFQVLDIMGGTLDPNSSKGLKGALIEKTLCDALGWEHLADGQTGRDANIPCANPNPDPQRPCKGLFIEVKSVKEMWRPNSGRTDDLVFKNERGATSKKIFINFHIIAVVQSSIHGKEPVSGYALGFAKPQDIQWKVDGAAKKTGFLREETDDCPGISWAFHPKDNLDYTTEMAKVPFNGDYVYSEELPGSEGRKCTLSVTYSKT
jgi:hypothetical protein